MALAAYTAGETLGELVADCTRLANCPDLGFDPATKAVPVDGAIRNAPAYRWLLDIIRNLYLEHDWSFAIKAGTLTLISSRCLGLPEDFWRCAYKNPLYILKAGTMRQPLTHITRPDFFDNSSLANPQSGVPSKFYVDRPGGQIFLDPPPNGDYGYELHYFKLIKELTSPVEVPEFPHREYLRQALLVKCFEDQNDTRISEARMELQQIFMRIRSSIYDFQENPEQTNISMLHPQYFRTVCFDD